MATVTFDDATRLYPGGDKPAVDRLNIETGDGEFLVLVGPSGSGKSTALRMLAGLEDVNAGAIRIGERDVTDLPPKDRDIAMVFQNYALYPHMTVAENMGFALKIAGVEKAKIRERVEDAAKILDLEPYLERKPKALSGGQRQRVAMGRAIVRNPQVFLMDEPLSNLDAKLRVQMRTEVSRLQRRLGTTTVYVTHDQTEAMTLGDRVVVMRGGVVQQVGAPQRLYDHPVNLFVAGFIGSPSMNFLPGTVENDELSTALGRLPLAGRLRRALEAANSPREVILGIRPEHFEDAALVEEHKRAAGGVFPAQVDVLESMGSDKYAYFSLDGDRASSAELEELAADAGTADLGSNGSQITTRLSAASSAAEGEEIDIWFDAEQVQVFDPSSGRNLTA